MACLGWYGVLLISCYWIPIISADGATFNTTWDCTIHSDVDGEDFQQALQSGNKMLYLLFSFTNNRDLTPVDINTPQPLTWVYVTGNHEKGLLWLCQDFEFYSLSSLSTGVDHLEIRFDETPVGCLSSQAPSNLSEKVRDFILNDFAGFDANVSWTQGEICNARFRLIDGEIDVYFLCCSKDESSNTKCYELKRSVWMNILILCLFIFPALGLLFAPFMIPYDLFKDSREDIHYQYKPDSNIQIRVTKCSDVFYNGAENDLILREEDVEDMVKFSDTLSKLQDQQTYDCFLEKIHFFVRKKDLIRQNADPFGPFKMLYHALARYKFRRRGLCEGKTIWEHLTILTGKIFNTVYLILILCLVNVPVIIRIIGFFYRSEVKWHINTSVAQLGLSVNFLHIASYGTSQLPRIEFYIIYVSLFGMFVITQFLAIKGMYRVNFVVEIFKQCLRDSRKIRVGMALQTIYKALQAIVSKKQYLVEYLLVPLYCVLFLPMVIISFIYYLLPVVNLFLSLPIYFFTFVLCNKCGFLSRSKYVKTFSKKVSVWLGLNYMYIKPETRGYCDDDCTTLKKSRLVDIFIIVLLIFSLPVVLFIVLDSLAFYIHIFIYVMLGLLLNASVHKIYVILVLLLAFYIRDLFRTVNKRYNEFNNTIIAEAIKKTKDEVYYVSLQNENIQKNTAFQIDDDKPILDTPVRLGDGKSTSSIRLAQEDDDLKWKVKRLLLFLDEKDTPYVPRQFFGEACKMDVVGAPGSFNQNLLKVLTSIVKILVFLFFIMLVVLAFEEVDENFNTNQSIMAIAGGLVPFLLRNFFPAPVAVPVDIENLHFREVINDVIRHYEQAWTVADIEISEWKVCCQQIFSKDPNANMTLPFNEEFNSFEKEGDVEPMKGESHTKHGTTDDVKPIIEPGFSGKKTECIELTQVPSTDKIKEEKSSIDHLVVFACHTNGAKTETFTNIQLEVR